MDAPPPIQPANSARPTPRRLRRRDGEQRPFDPSCESPEAANDGERPHVADPVGEPEEGEPGRRIDLTA